MSGPFDTSITTMRFDHTEVGKLLSKSPVWERRLRGAVVVQHMDIDRRITRSVRACGKSYDFDELCRALRTITKVADFKRNKSRILTMKRIARGLV